MQKIAGPWQLKWMMEIHTALVAIVLTVLNADLRRLTLHRFSWKLPSNYTFSYKSKSRGENTAFITIALSLGSLCWPIMMLSSISPRHNASPYL